MYNSVFRNKHNAITTADMKEQLNNPRSGTITSRTYIQYLATY